MRNCLQERDFHNRDFYTKNFEYFSNEVNVSHSYLKDSIKMVHKFLLLTSTHLKNVNNASHYITKAKRVQCNLLKYTGDIVQN